LLGNPHLLGIGISARLYVQLGLIEVSAFTSRETH